MSMPSNGSGHTALAEALLPPGVARFIGAILLVVAGTAVIAIAAKIKVPFFPVPMTMQTLAIMAIAAAYGSRLGVITVLVYLAEGLVGLPVFTNTPPAVAGPAYFLGTTGGFLAGFIVLAWIVGAAADRGWSRSIPKLAGAMLVGNIALFAMGFAWLAWFATLSSGATGLGIDKALAGGVVPFIPGGILKIALAALAVPAVWKLVDRRDA